PRLHASISTRFGIHREHHHQGRGNESIDGRPAVEALFERVTALWFTAPSYRPAPHVVTVLICAAALDEAEPAFASSPCTNTDSSGRWLPVMTTQIKTSNVSDLFAGVSLVTGIYTSTTVKGNTSGATSTAVAEGTVRI